MHIDRYLLSLQHAFEVQLEEFDESRCPSWHVFCMKVSADRFGWKS